MSSPRATATGLARRAVIAAALLSCAALAVTTDAQARACGLVGADYAHAEGGAQVRITSVRRITCKGAWRIVRTCIRHRRVRGWKARSHDDGRMVLRSRNRVIVMRGTAGGAPLCVP